MGYKEMFQKHNMTGFVSIAILQERTGHRSGTM